MKRLFFLLLGLGILSTAAGSAQAGTLGVANNFNEFIFTDSTRFNVDSEGQVAVGHNATFNNFTVGSNLTSGNVYGSNSAIIGNNLSGSQLNVDGHTPTNVLIGGTNSISNLYNNSGGTTSPGSIPNFFSDAQTYLNNLSQLLKNEVANGTTFANPYGQIILTTSGPSQLQVFNIDGSKLPTTNNITINASNPNDTIVINVSGTSDTMSYFGINLNGVDQTHVLFNFYDATSLTLNGMGIPGSILAPQAAVTGNYGQVNGSLIANSLYGTIETHLHPFAGNLPDPSPTHSAVPEPSSMGLLGLGTVVMTYFMRRRKFSMSASS